MTWSATATGEVKKHPHTHAYKWTNARCRKSNPQEELTSTFNGE